ncbi:MAG: hypothetical protein WCE68_03280 [Anaerolineales bacterium]
MKKTEFETMVDKAFWGLEAKYGFKKTETHFVNRTCTVQFKNATTDILLNYELGSTPWLEISDANNPDNKSTLGWLLVELGVDKAPRPEEAFRPTPLGEGRLDPTLQTLGQQLLDYGANLLKGDFAIMPKLQARAKKYDLECQRYLSIHKS